MLSSLFGKFLGTKGCSSSLGSKYDFHLTIFQLYLKVGKSLEL
jgi:hypothetical protein